MAKIKHILKLTANIILGLGCWLATNESDSLLPNAIGVLCIGLLIIINRNNGEEMQQG